MVWYESVRWNKQDSMILSAILSIICLIIGFVMLVRKGSKK